MTRLNNLPICKEFLGALYPTLPYKVLCSLVDASIVSRRNRSVLGYALSAITSTPYGYEATLKLVDGKQPYGADIQSVRLSIYFETQVGPSPFPRLLTTTISLLDEVEGKDLRWLANAVGGA